MTNTTTISNETNFTAAQANEMLNAVMHGINSYKGWNAGRLNEIRQGLGSCVHGLGSCVSRLEALEAEGTSEAAATKVDQESLDSATKALAEYLQVAVKDASADLSAAVDKRVEEVAPRESFITIKQGEAEQRLEGAAHKKLQQVLDVIAMGEIPMLVGPAGTGKTVLAKQVAEVLGVGYDGISCSGGLTEAKIFGRSVPNVQTGEEKYSSTAYVDAYENGGVFLFDEFDAADDNMMCSLNQSFDGGYMMIPERKSHPKADRSDQSYIICTANTYGTGADRQYVSRNQMDAATMDRFTIIEVDYDQEIENEVCPDQELLARFRKYRAAIQDNGLERIVSYRTLRKAYKQRQIGWTDDQIDAQYFAGWHYDEVIMVRGEAL